MSTLFNASSSRVDGSNLPTQETPPPKLSNEPDHFDDELNEQSRLLGDVPPPPKTQSVVREFGDDEMEDIEEHLGSKKVTARRGDYLWGFLGLGALLAMTIYTWVLVFSRPNAIPTLKYFAFHPPFQTLAVLLFAAGIMTLQPTSSDAPKAKKRGLKRHQVFMFGLGLPAILVGSLAMIVNKIDHGAPHFTSWHGKFGLIAIIWIVFQITAGAASVWFKGRAVGGEEEGKALWKWHRLSGYFLFPFLLLTIHLAGGYADWVHMNTNATARFWIYLILPLIAFLGVVLRLRQTKLPFFQSSS